VKISFGVYLKIDRERYLKKLKKAKEKQGGKKNVDKI